MSTVALSRLEFGWRYIVHLAKSTASGIAYHLVVVVYLVHSFHAAEHVPQYLSPSLEILLDEKLLLRSWFVARHRMHALDQ